MARKPAEPIPANDLVARCVFYPSKALAENVAVLDPTMMFPFEDGDNEESGYWRKYAPQEIDVHKRGCRKTRAKNKRLRDKIKTGQKPKEYYVGFLEGPKAQLEVTTDHASVAVTQEIEHGDRAHTKIHLVFNQRGNSHERAAWRSEARNLMAQQMGGPRSHVCWGERTNDDHPVKRLGDNCLVVAA